MDEKYHFLRQIHFKITKYLINYYLTFLFCTFFSIIQNSVLCKALSDHQRFAMIHLVRKAPKLLRKQDRIFLSYSHAHPRITEFVQNTYYGSWDFYTFSLFFGSIFFFIHQLSCWNGIKYFEKSTQLHFQSKHWSYLILSKREQKVLQ